MPLLPEDSEDETNQYDLKFNFPFRRKVRLVASQCDDNIGVALALELSHPVLRPIERFLDSEFMSIEQHTELVMS